MRVLVMGATGSGKSTFARELAARIGAPQIELDALNWDPDWTNFSQVDPEKLRARILNAVVPEAWTCDGNYAAVRQMVLERATHIVWLGYERLVIVARVIRRSVSRAIDGQELWAGTGNREDFRRWLDKEHPIRWAWDTFRYRRATYEKMFADPSNAHLSLHHVRRSATDLTVSQARPFPSDG